MDEKRYIFETVEITDDNGESRVVDVITDKEECYSYENLCDIAVLLNRQTRIIKGQDLEIQRLQNLAMAMSGVLREEFGVYDVFDRTKDKKI